MYPALIYSAVEIQQKGIYELKDTYSTFHDTNGKLNYNDVKSMSFNGNLKGGFFNGSVWAKTEVCNNQKSPIYFLYRDLIDSIEIYSDQLKEPIQHKFSGQNKLADHFWVLLALPIKGCTELYIRYTSGDVFNFNTFIIDQDNFAKMELNYILFYAFFYSVVLLILFLSLIFFFKTKNTLYFWFALLVVFQDILGASLLNGFLFRFAMPSDYFLEYDVGNFFAPVMNIALVVFAHKFVNNKYKVLTKISGAFVALQIIVVTPIIINFFYPAHSQNITTSEIVNTSILFSCLWVLIVALANYKNPNSWFFILASGPKVLGSFVKTLLLQGDISGNMSLAGLDMGYLIYNIGVLGSLFEAVVITTTLVLSYFKNIEEKSQALNLASEKLKSSELEAELVNTYKQVAHDIRSPLNALRVITASKDKLPPDLANILSLAIDRIKEIASDLNKKSTAKTTNPESIFAVDFIKLMKDLLTEKNAEFSSHSKLEFKLSSDLNKDNENIELQLDCSAIKRALSNLLNNAAEASEPNDCINLNIEISNDLLKIIIQDSGKGMSQDILERLGTKGFSFGKKQLEAAGTGLGYHYSLNVVKQHGGTISTQSTSNVGTKVTILLPIVPRHTLKN